MKEKTKNRIKAIFANRKEWTWFEAWAFITIAGMLIYFPIEVVVSTWRLITDSQMTQFNMTIYLLSWLISILVIIFGFLAYRADMKKRGKSNLN